MSHNHASLHLLETTLPIFVANQGGVRISIDFYDSSRMALICEIEIRRSRGNKSESSHNNMHIAKLRESRPRI